MQFSALYLEEFAILGQLAAAMLLGVLMRHFFL